MVYVFAVCDRKIKRKKKRKRHNRIELKIQLFIQSFICLCSRAMPSVTPIVDSRDLSFENAP